MSVSDTSDSSLLENRSSNPVSVDARPASSFPPCGNREGRGGHVLATETISQFPIDTIANTTNKCISNAPSPSMTIHV